MFDRLIEFLLNSLEFFRCGEIINEYSAGVVLRLGKFHRVLGPGLHPLIPFYVERLLVDNIVPHPRPLREQSLTTADGRSVIIRAIVTARITDIRKALLAVEGVDGALVDACSGEVARVVCAATWEELHTGTLADKLTTACRKRGWKWGIEIQEVQLSDMTLGASIRLFSDKVESSHGLEQR